MHQPFAPAAHARAASQQLQQLADVVDTTATGQDTYLLLADMTDVVTCLHRILTRLAVLHRHPTGITDPTGDPALGRELSATVVEQLRRTTEQLAAADVPLRHAWTVSGQLIHPDRPAPAPPSPPRRPGAAGRALDR